MPTAPVVSTSEVSLDTVRYPAQNLMPILLNQQIPRVNTGVNDPGLEDKVSRWQMHNLSGGHGKYRVDLAAGETLNRLWDSCMRTDQDELGLLPLPTLLVDMGAAVTCMLEWSGATYFAAGTVIRRWDGTNVQFYCTDHNTWETHPVTGGHTAKALPATAVSMTIWNGNLIIWCGTDYIAYDGGTTWNDDTTNVSYAVVFDSTVYAVDSTGQIRSSSDPEVAAPAWANVARIYDDTPTGMAVYEDGGGDPAIYISTIRTPYVLDTVTAKVYPIMPGAADRHGDNGRGLSVWNNTLVYGKGGNVRMWNIQGREAQAADIGPNKDDGLSSTRVGRIAAIDTSLENMLLAAVDGSSRTSSILLYDGTAWHTIAVAMQQLSVTAATNASPIVITTATHGLSTGDIVTISGALGNTAANGTWIITVLTSTTFSLDGSAGSGAWTSGGTCDARKPNASIRCMAYETHTTVPRLLFGQGNEVWNIPLHDITANPQTAPSSTYRSHGWMITPWLSLGNSKSVALDLRSRCRGISDDEQVDIYAAYNGDDTTWTLVSSIPGNGVTAIKFSSLGQQFYSVRYMLVLSRGTTTTNQPRIQDAVLRWTPAPSPLWGFSMELDLSRPYKGRQPSELESALMASADGLLVVFSYRPNDDRYVKIEQCQALVGTGHDTRGRWRVTVAEQIASDVSTTVTYFNWDGQSLWDGTKSWT